MRPKSIVIYEFCYLGSVLLGAAKEALNWNLTNSAQAQATLGPNFMPLFMVFVYTLSLLLWYFTARSPSLFAKWAVVVFFVFSVLGFGAVVATGNALGNVAGMALVGSLVLNAVAVWMLFRPDARAWFGEAA